MGIGIGVIIGLVVGGIAAYFAVQAWLKQSVQGKVDEANRKADLTIQEAALTSKRKIDEAEIKSQSILSKADAKNEQIKQQKIQEAKDRFNQMKSDMDREKGNWQAMFEKEKIGRAHV